MALSFGLGGGGGWNLILLLKTRRTVKETASGALRKEFGITTACFRVEDRKYDCFYSWLVDLVKEIIKVLVEYDKKECFSFDTEFWENVENLGQSFNSAKIFSK